MEPGPHGPLTGPRAGAGAAAQCKTQLYNARPSRTCQAPMSDPTPPKRAPMTALAKLIFASRPHLQRHRDQP